MTLNHREKTNLAEYHLFREAGKCVRGVKRLRSNVEKKKKDS